LRSGIRDCLLGGPYVLSRPVCRQPVLVKWRRCSRASVSTSTTTSYPLFAILKIRCGLLSLVVRVSRVKVEVLGRSTYVSEALLPRTQPISTGNEREKNPTYKRKDRVSKKAIFAFDL
jgi:hypothetical protein